MGFGEWVGRVDKLQGTYVYLCLSILRTEPLGVQALASIGEIKNNTMSCIWVSNLRALTVLRGPGIDNLRVVRVGLMLISSMTGHGIWCGFSRKG